MLRVRPWMYRYPGEWISLIVGIFLILIVLIFVGSINLYIIVGLVVYRIFSIVLEQSQYLGNSIRVYEKQFPEIYEVFKKFAYQLGVSKAALYIKNDPILNAYTVGINKCTVVLHSALVEQLNLNELGFVIGHELAHYQAGHTKISTFIADIGSTNFVSNFFFGFWQRKGEFSCDRCALILTKDIDSAISALIKLSIGAKLFRKLDMDAYVHQLKTAIMQNVGRSELILSHPVITNRILNLVKFWHNNFINKKNEL